MTATIYKFPLQEKETTYRIPLYNDQEIEVVLVCVNVFCEDDLKYDLDTLSFLDPLIVIDCLKMALVSNIFSERFKSHIKSIMKNVEEIK